MDETTLRGLAEQLLTELPQTIPDDAERAPIADAIAAALSVPDGEGRGPLLDALSAHPATRAWMREHGASEDVVRSGLPGNPTTPLGLYYVCPEDDEDLVLLTVPAQPPLCPVHGVPMTLQG
ncbi:MAG: hypothetical protein AB7V44_01050 [Pseudonocardia sp.]